MRSSGYSINMKPASAQTYFLQVQETADSNEKTVGKGLKGELAWGKLDGMAKWRMNDHNRSDGWKRLSEVF